MTMDTITQRQRSFANMVVLSFESDHGHVKHDDGHEGHPCPDGIYPCPQHCEDFYICYGNGAWADQIDCPPDKVFNDRLKECDYPWNLKEDDRCYAPKSYF